MKDTQRNKTPGFAAPKNVGELRAFIKARIAEKQKEGNFDITPYNDGSGYKGTYHLNYSKEFNNLWVSISDNTDKPLQFTLKCHDDEIESLKSNLKEVLESDYHFFKHREGQNINEHSDAELGFYIRQRLAAAEKNFPDDFAFSKDHAQAGGKPKYIYSLGTNLPHGRHSNIELVVSLREAEQIEQTKTEFVKDAYKVFIATGTDDLQEAEKYKDRIMAILKEYGIAEYALKEGGLKAEKEIPKEWIKLDKIKLAEDKAKSGKSYNRIGIVVTDPKMRLPGISVQFSSLSGDPKKVVEYIKDELLPAYLKGGEYADVPITQKLIREKVEERFPDFFPEIVRSPNRSDIRHVTNPAGAEVAMLITPGVIYDSQAGQIKITPPQTRDHPYVIQNSVTIALNTSDEERMHRRTTGLQAFTKIVLEDYFKKHPDITISTQARSRFVNGKAKEKLGFKMKGIGETAPEGKVFFETLRDEVLKPSYEDFNRYIYWQTEVTPEKDGDKESYKITARVRRGAGDETFDPEVENLMGRTWEFSAKTPEAAEAFAHKLEENLMREQHHYSRERGVQNFGIESMRLVTKASLVSAMRASPQVEDLQPHLTQHLKGKIALAG